MAFPSAPRRVRFLVSIHSLGLLLRYFLLTNSEKIFELIVPILKLLSFVSCFLYAFLFPSSAMVFYFSV